MRGLMRALDGYRRDQDGRKPLAQIPAIYLVAMDLAARVEADASVDDGVPRAIRDRFREASLVADHAERLVAEDGTERPGQ
jgi:hypothetical protein